MKLDRILTFSGLLAFVLLGIFGLGHFSGMPINEGGEMDGCIFAGGTMLCKMSVIEHIALWQSMFTAVPQESATVFVLLALFIAVIFTIKNILAPPRLFKHNALAYKLYLARHPDLPLFNPLKEALSRGIINPKIY